MDRWFRLDIILIDSQADDGDGPHEELKKMLASHPAVATFGMTSTTEGARRYMMKRVVNTVFINVRPVPSPVYWKELNTFLLDLNKKDRNVLVVFYAKPKERESFLSQYPAFRKHYFTPAGWVSPNEPNTIPFSQSFYQKLNEWHMDRYVYDVAISYASENIAIAQELWKRLLVENRVFYGEKERGNLWGKDLNRDLLENYKTQSRKCLVVLSAEYLQKHYTQHELEAALERQNSGYYEDYLLIVKIDGSVDRRISSELSFLPYKAEEDLPGILDSIHNKLWRDDHSPKCEYFGRDADRNNDRLTEVNRRQAFPG